MTDEKQNTEEDLDDEYRLTAKGFICAGKELAEGQLFWSKLEAFVAATAKRDGYKNGIPAIVFTPGGGSCVLASGKRAKTGEQK